MLVAAILGAALGAILTAYVVVARDRRHARGLLEAARAEKKMALSAAELTATSLKRAAETEGREQGSRVS